MWVIYAAQLHLSVSFPCSLVFATPLCCALFPQKRYRQALCLHVLLLCGMGVLSDCQGIFLLLQVVRGLNLCTHVSVQRQQCRPKGHC